MPYRTHYRRPYRWVRCLGLLPLLLTAPAYAQLAGGVPADSATARAALQTAARQYPKFYRALTTLQRQDTLLRRFVLVQTRRPGAGPAAAGPDGIVRFDVRYLQQPQPGFDDNRLVVVLYHEIGHLHYFRQVPPARRTPEASERAAFAYSLLMSRQLADAGDCGPLRTGLYFMRRRSQSPDLADPHVAALRLLLHEPLYADYQRYAAEHCQGQP